MGRQEVLATLCSPLGFSLSFPPAVTKVYIISFRSREITNADYLKRAGRENLCAALSKSRGEVGLSRYSAAPALSALVFN